MRRNLWIVVKRLLNSSAAEQEVLSLVSELSWLCRAPQWVRKVDIS